MRSRRTGRDSTILPRSMLALPCLRRASRSSERSSQTVPRLSCLPTSELPGVVLPSPFRVPSSAFVLCSALRARVRFAFHGPHSKRGRQAAPLHKHANLFRILSAVGFFAVLGVLSVKAREQTGLCIFARECFARSAFRVPRCSLVPRSDLRLLANST